MTRLEELRELHDVLPNPEGCDPCFLLEKLAEDRRSFFEIREAFIGVEAEHAKTVTSLRALVAGLRDELALLR